MPKVRDPKSNMRHTPFAEELERDAATRNLRAVPRNNKRTKKIDDEENEDTMVMDSAMSKKLLAVVEEQQKEDDDAIDMAGARENQDFEFEEIEDIEIDEEGFIDIDLDDKEEEAMRMFMNPQKETKLLDISAMITKAIDEKKTNINEAIESTTSKHQNELSPKVIEVYTNIGIWLKKYKSGAIPKAFKVIPTLRNWEEVLCLTNPLDWSPNAMMEATKIFASNLNSKMAQRFYNLVLLPAIRQNLTDYSKLNFHYYEALKKSIFKPAAFMKGILLPLCQDSCTLKEAHIIASILGKISVPVLHSSATIIKLCEMTPWYGTTSIIMSVLINKKYSLPYSVLNSISDHFCSFMEDTRALPLVWHRCLLIFIQRYKQELTMEQRLMLKSLLKIHFHSGIGPECKREIQSCIPKSMGTSYCATSMEF